MDILTTEEIKKITTNFLNKNSKRLECKTYGFEEIVHREGERSRKIYIVKNGVFRIGRIDTPIPDVTLGFCFRPNVIPSIASIVPNYPSLLQIKSISNNISNCNSLYEITIEEKHWNDLIRILNRAKWRGLFLEMFGPKYDMMNPDYNIEIHYKDNEKAEIQLWDGHSMFTFGMSHHWLRNGWYKIKENDTEILYNILASIKMNIIKQYDIKID